LGGQKGGGGVYNRDPIKERGSATGAKQARTLAIARAEDSGGGSEKLLKREKNGGEFCEGRQQSVSDKTIAEPGVKS